MIHAWTVRTAHRAKLSGARHGYCPTNVRPGVPIVVTGCYDAGMDNGRTNGKGHGMNAPTIDRDAVAIAFGTPFADLFAAADRATALDGDRDAIDEFQRALYGFERDEFTLVAFRTGAAIRFGETATDFLEAAAAYLTVPDPAEIFPGERRFANLQHAVALLTDEFADEGRVR